MAVAISQCILVAGGLLDYKSPYTALVKGKGVWRGNDKDSPHPEDLFSTNPEDLFSTHPEDLFSTHPEDLLAQHDLLHMRYCDCVFRASKQQRHLLLERAI